MITFIDTPEDFAVTPSDVYYHPQYGLSAAPIDNGTWECAVDPSTGISYSYVRRGISGRPAYYDTITPYGYGGLSHDESASDRDVHDFRQAYLAAARDRGLVAEFTRLNPLDPVNAFVNSADRVRRHVTFGSHVTDPEREFAAVSGKHRTAVRRAVKLGVLVEESPVDELATERHPFRQIYDATMQRLNARQSLRFDRNYYESLLRLPRASVRLLLASLDGNVVAGAIFFVWGARIHYHLSASSPEGRNAHATNAIIEFAKRNLILPPYDLHLGGGLSDNDSLAQFKRRCSSSTLEMAMTELVTNRHVFDELIQGFELTDYFPPYRASLASKA